MASMQCDICGERLTMDVSGQFAVCDYCGIKHPKARLMKKVSGISGDSGETKEQPEKAGFIPKPEPVSKPEPVFQPVPEPVPVLKPEPVPEPEFVSIPESVSEPEPAVTVEQPSQDDFKAEAISEPEMGSVYSEPIFVNRASSQTPVMGAMDIGMEAEVGGMQPTNENANIGSATDGMTAAEIAEYEKKNSRIEELKVELKEFEEIYEANKNKFLGEGLKRKNYSEIKIKEIKEKLDELGA